MRGTIPLPQNNISEIFHNAGPLNINTNISSNGYYGYQPQIPAHGKNGLTNQQHMGGSNVTQDMDMEIEHAPHNNTRMEINIPPHCDRKRRRQHQQDEVEIFKKRREASEEVPIITPWNQVKPPALAQSSPVYLQKPTHNIPDLHRCLMGHYV